MELRDAKMTDPDVVAEFVRSTAVDALAVTIGNVHGAYASPPNLDWERLRSIGREARNTPLVLHGASGLPLADVHRAIQMVTLSTVLSSRNRALPSSTLIRSYEPPPEPPPKLHRTKASTFSTSQRPM